MPSEEVGPDTLVNEPVAEGDIAPMITGLAGGGFVVVWYGNDGDSIVDIRARIFDEAGSPLGPAFTILDNMGGGWLPQAATVEALPNGGFAIAAYRALEVDAEGFITSADIAVQFFDASGNAVTALTSVSGPGIFSEPEMTVLEDGSVVVAWSGGGAHGRIYDLDGNALGDAFRIAEGWHQVNDQGWLAFSHVEGPDVAPLVGGGFVAVWNDSREVDEGGDESGSSIRGRLFGGAGVPLGPEFLINTTTTGDQTFPRVVPLSSGGYVVTWADAADGAWLIKARLFDQDGNPVSAEILLADTHNTDPWFFDHSLAPLAGGFVVTWTSDEDGLVYAQEFDQSGTAVSDARPISDHRGDYPNVAPQDDGGYVISWSDHIRFDIFVQRFEPPSENSIARAKLLLTESGQDFTIGGDVMIIGTTGGGEEVRVIRGDILLDASFNIGGDTVALPGNAGSYTAILSGSFVTIAGGDVSIAIPVGANGLTVEFADAERSLRFDPGAGQVLLGEQAIGSTAEAVDPATTPFVSDGPDTGPASLAKLLLTEAGQDIDIGGNVLIVGTTSGGEVITVLSGTIVLDASFNIGGDTVVLPDVASSYTATLSGSFVTIAGGDVSIAIPVGVNGLTVDFADADRTLRFDPGSGQVMLGDQAVSATTAPVTAARMAGELLFDVAGGKDIAEPLYATDLADLLSQRFEFNDSFYLG